MRVLEGQSQKFMIVKLSCDDIFGGVEVLRGFLRVMGKGRILILHLFKGVLW